MACRLSGIFSFNLFPILFIWLPLSFSPLCLSFILARVSTQLYVFIFLVAYVTLELAVSVDWLVGPSIYLSQSFFVVVFFGGEGVPAPTHSFATEGVCRRLGSDFLIFLMSLSLSHLGHVSTKFMSLSLLFFLYFLLFFSLSH